MDIIATTTGGVSRVSLRLGGATVWFESPDIALAPAPEAFAGLALIPAAHHAVRIPFNLPLSPRWVTGATRILAQHRDWWGAADAWPLTGYDTAAPAPAPPRGTCSLFSGGIDSFHTLLQAPPGLEALVFVQGLDMDIDDRRRAAAAESGLHRVAARRGLRPVRVRTNLRRHPLVRAVPWSVAHGAALAAVGHGLRGHYARLLIPASSTLDDVGRWGSHWSTDAHWSSETVEIEHHDPALHRNDKTRQLAHEPLLWDTLRVCWRNLAPHGNCSRCEKCVKTMVLLHAAGALPHYRVFCLRKPLARRVRALRTVPPHMVHTWEDILEHPLEPELRGEITALVRRSRSTPARRAGEALRRWHYGLAGWRLRRRYDDSRRQRDPAARSNR